MHGAHVFRLRGEKASELTNGRAEECRARRRAESSQQREGAETREKYLPDNGIRQQPRQMLRTNPASSQGRQQNRRVKQRRLNIGEDRISAIGKGIPQRPG